MKPNADRMQPRATGGRGGVKLLVAVDLEDPDCSAIEQAFSLARLGGEIHLVHVLRPPVLPDPLYAHYAPGRFPTDRERQERRREIELRLRALGEAQAARGPAAMRVHVPERDDVEAAIAELAAELDVNLVCVLARRKVAPGRCGRLTRRLLARCPRPLLVVRPSR